MIVLTSDDFDRKKKLKKNLHPKKEIKKSLIANPTAISTGELH
jgi:lysyl-tRNA synthetase class I